MRQHGFSVLEAVVAMALMLTVTAVAVALVDPARATFAPQLESADMQQRLRVAAGTLYKDLVMAGAGAYQGAHGGSLVRYFAPILPYRRGTDHDDPAETFRADTITVMYVPPTTAQTTLATSVTAIGADGEQLVSADIQVNSGPGCPPGDAACGFRSGMTVLLYDASGGYDTFRITGVQSNVLHADRTGATLTSADYPPDTTTIVQLASVTYSLRSDPSTGMYQLMSQDEGTGGDVPVVDHLVALAFDYYGDPQPPLLIRPPGDPLGPRTSYGPAPPLLTEQIPTGGYPPGENCTFTIDPIGGLQVPRLAIIDGGNAEGSLNGTGALVPLTGGQLTDGPWCPDALSANRWDADLLRIRSIGVTLRVESANAALRGPASVLFAHGGTWSGANRWLPDQQVTFRVTPRNLLFNRD